MDRQRRLPRTRIHRLIAGVTTVVCAAGVLAVLPAATAAADTGFTTSKTLVYIQNSAETNALLCADPDDANVWITSAVGDAYCQWEQIGDDGQVVFYNPAKGMVLTAPGTIGPLQMKDPAYPFTATQTFVWGSQTGGARSLQWYGDKLQYVDGGAGQAGPPTQNPVQTANWRANDPTLLWQLASVGTATAQPTQPASAVYIENGNWPDQMLCASVSDGTVRLSTDKTNPACQWLPFARSSGEFVLYNPWAGQVMTYPGGSAQQVAMKSLAYPNNNSQLWSLGSLEGWGAYALQWFGDNGQNIDAGTPNPTTGPVTTRGWRGGNQRQMTWNFVQVIPPTALVTLGDSFMSGEGGRWQGNSNNPLLSRDGTDRAYLGWGTYDPHVVYGTSYDNGCNRSDSAEGHSSGVMQVQINLACSGATTANVISAQAGGQPFKGEAPQADQLLAVAKRYNVKVIALSIGGNDLGFSTIIQDCILSYTTGASPCNAQEQANVEAQLGAVQANVEAAIKSIQATMAQVKDTDYRIILQSAPSPLPRAAEMRYPEGTWDRWHTGGCPFWDVDATWARDTLVNEISTMLATAATDTGADFLDLSNTLQGREVCSVSDALVNGSTPPSDVTSEWARFLVTGIVQGQSQESFHPNYYGQLALGRCLALMAASPTLNKAACQNTPGAGTAAMYLTVP